MKRFLSVLAGALILVQLTGCGDDFRTAEKAADAGDWKMAMAISEKCVKKHPKDIKGLLLLAVSAEKCGQHKVALDAAWRAVKLNEKDFTAQYTLGKLCIVDPAGREEGLKHLIIAHELNPNAEEPLVEICNTMLEMQHPKSFSYILKLQSFKDYPQSAAYYNDFALACIYAKKRDAAAVNGFSRANELDRANPIIPLNMARFFESTKRWKRNATSFYALFLANAGDKPEYHDDVVAVKKKLGWK